MTFLLSESTKKETKGIAPNTDNYVSFVTNNSKFHLGIHLIWHVFIGF